MNKSPEEIKKGLECCVIGPSAHQPKCGECPYKFVPMCSDTFLKDALAYIQQLEAQNAELSGKIGQLQAERDELLGMIEKECYFCKWNFSEHPDCPCLECDGESEFEWRGVQKEE